MIVTILEIQVFEHQIKIRSVNYLIKNIYKKKIIIQ
jgi:hypothetical protein